MVIHYSFPAICNLIPISLFSLPFKPALGRRGIAGQKNVGWTQMASTESQSVTGAYALPFPHLPSVKCQRICRDLSRNNLWQMLDGQVHPSHRHGDTAASCTVFPTNAS